MLGDLVHEALAKVGVTEERVSRWLGAPCDCDARRQKLNAIGWWAAKAIRSPAEAAKRWLEGMIEESPESTEKEKR